MGPSSGPPPPQYPGEPIIRFHCPACHHVLSVPAHLLGTTGPCPLCGTLITAPAPLPTVAPLASHPTDPEPPSPPQKRKRGTLLADANVDYTHSERVQAAQVLKIIALAVLVLSFCLAVAWFMLDWSSR